MTIQQDLDTAVAGRTVATRFLDTLERHGDISVLRWKDSSGEWHSGAGIGLRYATPIGPLRVDVAAPVSGDTDGEDFYLYFGIGHSF